jgi:hypothetical protein
MCRFDRSGVGDTTPNPCPASIPLDPLPSEAPAVLTTTRDASVAGTIEAIGGTEGHPLTGQ